MVEWKRQRGDAGLGVALVIISLAGTVLSMLAFDSFMTFLETAEVRWSRTIGSLLVAFGVIVLCWARKARERPYLLRAIFAIGMGMLLVIVPDAEKAGGRLPKPLVAGLFVLALLLSLSTFFIEHRSGKIRRGRTQ